MSALTDCQKLVLVPNDMEKPVVGILVAADGRAEERHRTIAHELGYSEGSYTLRNFEELEEAYEHQAKG